MGRNSMEETPLADVIDHLRRLEPGKGAAQVLGNGRMAHGVTAHMGLVDDRLVPGHLHGVVAAPGEGRIDDLGLGYEGRAVALVEAEVGILVADGVAEQRFGPAQLAHQLFGIGVDQQLVRVETMAGVRLVGAVDAIAVDLPRVRVRQVAVPDLVGVLGQLDALDFGLALVVEQAQLDLCRVRREDGEVDAKAVPGGA